MGLERWKKGTSWQYKLSLVNESAVQQKPQIELKVSFEEKPEEGLTKVVEKKLNFLKNILTQKSESLHFFKILTIIKY